DSARSLAESSSSRRVEFGEFLPFVELTYDYRYVSDKTQRNRRDERRDGVAFGDQTTFREAQTTTNELGLGVTQNLPWGGDLSANLRGRRARDRDSDFDTLGVNDEGNDIFVEGDDEISRDYRVDVEFGYTQPLLRGAGWTAG